MAEAKLTMKSGEIFVFSTSSSPSTTLKDAIASVSKLQADVNSKLTEIVNEEKDKTGNNKERTTERGGTIITNTVLFIRVVFYPMYMQYTHITHIDKHTYLHTRTVGEEVQQEKLGADLLGEKTLLHSISKIFCIIEKLSTDQSKGE